MKKIEAEYTVNSSPGVLYSRLSTASGLAEWFADDVTIDKEGLYHFTWDGEEEVAKLLSKKNLDFVKFHWMHLEEGTYLEFRLKTDPLTKDLALLVTFFAEEGEEEAARMLWDNQIDELLHILGS
ncbi:MAG: hypothetical protein RL266_489 [Bacteroidota bacterium]|jgi:uncharacterized protein YndB with AHSA1/START domain